MRNHATAISTAAHIEKPLDKNYFVVALAFNSRKKDVYECYFDVSGLSILDIIAYCRVITSYMQSS